MTTAIDIPLLSLVGFSQPTIRTLGLVYINQHEQKLKTAKLNKTQLTLV